MIAYSTGSGVSGATYGYGPNGEPNVWSGSRYRYAGQLMLPEAQLYYYKARVYDPVSGRFLQTDPVGYDSDINPYTYTMNDPVNATDPTGLGKNACDISIQCEDTPELPPIDVNTRRLPQFWTKSPAVNVGREIPAGTGGDAGGAPQNDQHKKHAREQSKLGELRT